MDEVQQGVNLDNIEKYTEAIKCYNKAISSNPNDIEAHYRKGKSLFVLQKYEEAIKSNDQTISLKPDHFGAYNNKGLCLYNLQKYEEAIQYLNKAVSIKPDYVYAYFNKGLCYHEMRKYEEAIDSYTQVISLKPDHVTAYNNKGFCLYKISKYEEAIESLNKAISLKPDYSDAYNNLGLCLHEVKNYDEAIECYEKVITFEPNYIHAHYNKGYSLFIAQKYNEAIDCFSQVISLKSNHINAYFYKGICLRNLLKTNEAVEFFKEVIALRPDYADAYNNKGLCFYDIKKYSKAVESFQEAIRLNGKHSLYHCNLARAFKSLGKQEEAMHHFELARKYLEESREYLVQDNFSYIKRNLEQIIELETEEETLKESLKDIIPEENKELHESVTKFQFAKQKVLDDLDVEKDSSTSELEKMKQEILMLKNQFLQLKQELNHKMDDYHIKLLSHLEAQSLSEVQISKVTRYFDAFLNTFSSAYNTSQIIDSGKIELQTKHIVCHILSGLVAFGIPENLTGTGGLGVALGRHVFKGVPQVLGLAIGTGYRRESRRMLRLASDSTSLTQLAGEVCYRILLNQMILKEISESDEHTVVPLFENRLKKLIRFCKDIGEGVESFVYTSRYSSVQAKMGHCDATNLIKLWLKEEELLDLDEKGVNYVKELFVNEIIKNYYENNLAKEFEVIKECEENKIEKMNTETQQQKLYCNIF